MSSSSFQHVKLQLHKALPLETRDSNAVPERTTKKQTTN